MLDASLEVRSAVVYASLIVILVFVPVFFLEGLCRLVLPPAGPGLRPGDPGLAAGRPDGDAGPVADAPDRGHANAGTSRRWSRVLKAIYRAILPPLVRRPGWSRGHPAGRLRRDGLARRRLGEEFLPNFQENDFLMHWVEKPGTSLEAMRRITVHASKELPPIPGVRNFGSHIGRAEVADEVVGPNFTELWISVDPKVDHAATVGEGPGRGRRLPGPVPATC